jgi:hypothetical protein
MKGEGFVREAELEVESEEALTEAKHQPMATFTPVR